MTGAGIFKPDTLTENLNSLNSVLRQSYTQAKKHLQDGISVIKDEFLGIYDIFAHPVNNFLKDINQIDQELQAELCRENVQFSAIVTSINVIPLDQALQRPMEENY